MAEENQVTKVPKPYRRKHTWWRYLLVFFGGVLFTAVGCAAGAAIYSTTVPVSQVVGLLPSEFQSYLQFLDENDTVFTSVMKFVNGDLTVDDILESIEIGNVITPEMVGEKLYVKLCYYKDTTAEPSSSAHLEATMEDGEKEPGTKVTIPEGYKPINLYMIINGAIPDGKGGTVNFVDNLMNQLCIEDVMDVPSDSPLYALRQDPITTIADTIMDKPLSALFPSGEGMIKAVGNKTLRELTQDGAFDDVALCDVLGVDSSTDDQLMKLLCFRKVEDPDNPGTKIIDFNNKVTIGDLSDPTEMHNIVDNLNIEDVIIPYDDTNTVLKAIKGTSIGELSNKLSELKLKDVVNLDGTSGLAKGFLTELQDKKISEIDTEFNNVKLVKGLASEIYESDGTTVKGEWKFMLYENINGDPEAQKAIYEAYTLANFSKLTENMKNNMKIATLQQLKDEGFVNADQSTLNKQVIVNMQLKKLGDLTISELLEYVGSLA